MEKIRIIIDGNKIEAVAGQTILAIAIANGVEIPHLCHNDMLEIYASCGICTVEVAGAPRLARACSTVATDGMEIFSNSARVRANRKAALELMLSNHVGDCRPPCQLACPGQTDCQGYVGLAANGESALAMRLIMEKIPLPASIGRVCPRPCEDACRRALVDESIAIGSIKEFIADANADFAPEVGAPTGRRVAIIGGGPGGLSAAYFLRRAGHEAVIFDAMPEMGGMLRYGIPKYRLPHAVLDAEIARIKAMGVVFENNTKIGIDINLENLQIAYDAVIAAVGAWSAVPLGCPGENLGGVFGGIDFLRDVAMGNAPNFEGQKVAVIGGGNTAMDACRTAARLGASAVYNIYRRTREEMPAQDIEITEAMDEGVIFKYLVNPSEILGEGGQVSALNLQIMELGEPDERGRRRPVPVEGATEILSVDKIIVAIGQRAALAGLEALCPNSERNIAVRDNFSTNIPGIFAIGDATGEGAGIAIEAIADARAAVHSVSQYLDGLPTPLPYLPTEKFLVADESKTAEDYAHVAKAARMEIPHRAGEARRRDFEPVNLPLSREAVENEAMRCLECGCADYFGCKLLKYANDYDVAPEKFLGEIKKQPGIQGEIVYDPNKCILCGLCVRVCEEVVGLSALGLVDRGFNTAVAPALRLNLEETDCNFCNYCTALCPTGALMPKSPLKKPTPLKPDGSTETAEAIHQTHGHITTRTIPKIFVDSAVV